MVKAILFDIDGVLIHYNGLFFSRTLSPEIYIEPEKTIDEYYHSEINKMCDKGIANPYEQIRPFLNRIGYKGTSYDFMNEQWQYEKTKVDYDLLEKIGEIKKAGVKTYIASNQNKYRKDFLIREMKLEYYFERTFFSCDIGYVKNENEYWKFIKDNLKTENRINKLEDIVFYDDMNTNIECAYKNGINGEVINCRNDIWDKINNIYKKIA